MFLHVRLVGQVTWTAPDLSGSPHLGKGLMSIKEERGHLDLAGICYGLPTHTIGLYKHVNTSVGHNSWRDGCAYFQKSMNMFKRHKTK